MKTILLLLILIASLQSFAEERRNELRIYDISDLVETKQGRPGPDICLVIVRSEPLSVEAVKATEIVIQKLKASNVDAWKENNVDIEERGGRLVVIHRPEVHQQIGNFLSELRADVKKKLLEEKK